MVPKRQNQTKMNMKVFFFFICLLLVSCVAQNEFGIHRHSKSKYKIEANSIDVKIEELKKQRETILKNVVWVCLEKYKQEILQ